MKIYLWVFQKGTVPRAGTRMRFEPHSLKILKFNLGTCTFLPTGKQAPSIQHQRERTFSSGFHLILKFILHVQDKQLYIVNASHQAKYMRKLVFAHGYN